MTACSAFYRECSARLSRLHTALWWSPASPLGHWAVLIYCASSLSLHQMMRSTGIWGEKDERRSKEGKRWAGADRMLLFFKPSLFVIIKHSSEQSVALSWRSDITLHFHQLSPCDFWRMQLSAGGWIQAQLQSLCLGYCTFTHKHTKQLH